MNLPMPNNLLGEPIIFTDLDGSLLDHHNYSFDAAKPALAAIKSRGIPLIINSSKTFAEVSALQKLLAISDPFICENGAAVYLPRDDGSWQCQGFGQSHETIISVIKRLRRQHHFYFTGFADINTQAIAKCTGLSLAQAELASRRGFSEPLIWQGNQLSQQKFISLLASEGLQAMQGGRFLTISGAQSMNKGLAMQWLCKYLKSQTGVREYLTIALGDSPNDFPMLAMADIAVLIRSGCDHAIQFEQAKAFIRTTKYGPEGWQAAMQLIIPWLDTLKKRT